MRNIILPGKVRRDDLARARRTEKESVAARDRRILEFPLSKSPKAGKGAQGRRELIARERPSTILGFASGMREKAERDRTS